MIERLLHFLLLLLFSTSHELEKDMQIYLLLIIEASALIVCFARVSVIE